MAVPETSYADLARDIEVGNGVPYDEERIFNCVSNASSGGDGCSTFAIARWHLCGIERPSDRVLAGELYLKAVKQGCACAAPEAMFHFGIAPDLSLDPHLDPEHCKDLLRYTVGFTFGFDIQKSRDRAHVLASKFAAQNMRRCVHRALAEAMLSHVLSDNAFIDRFFAFFRTHAAHPARVSDMQLDLLWSLCAPFKKQAAITFVALRAFAHSEGWGNYPSWRRRAVLSEIELLGVELRSLTASHSAIGLPQNELSREGLIIPSRYVPWGGRQGAVMTDLDGIHYETNGNTITSLFPVGRNQRDCPSLITEEDFAVATCLAFGETDADDDDIGISLDLPSRHFASPRISGLMQKNFTPHWLGATEFGGSLYCADLMAGRFDDGRGLVSFTNPLHVESSDLANKIRGYFTRYTAAHPVLGSDGARICLSLYSIHNIATSKRHSFFTSNTIDHTLMFDRIGFRIDGSGVNYLESGREAVYENDPSRPEAHGGISLTNRLAKLESAFPVFRRVKFLLALTRTLVELRRSGLRLNSQLMSEVQMIRDALIQKSQSICLYATAP